MRLSGILKAAGLLGLGLAGLAITAWAGPSGPPAGNYILNVSTLVTKPAINISSGTVRDQLSLPYATPDQFLTVNSSGVVVSSATSTSAADVFKASTQTFTGTNTFISSSTFNRQVTVKTTGAGASTGTGGSILIDATNEVGMPLQVYSSSANQSGFFGMANLTNTNTNYANAYLYISGTSSSTAKANLYLTDPNPNIRFVQTGVSSPAGQYDFAVIGDTLQFQSMNAGGSAYKPRLGMTHPGALTFYEISDNGHYVALRASQTIPANVTWVLPNADSQGLMQSDGLGHLTLGTTFYTSSGSISGPLNVFSSIVPSSLEYRQVDEPNEANLVDMRWSTGIDSVTTQAMTLYAKFTSTSNTVNALADGGAGYFWARDTGAQNGNLRALSTRVTGQSQGPAEYVALNAYGQFVDDGNLYGTTATLRGINVPMTITQSDGSTPFSTGTVKQIELPKWVGSGAPGKSWTIYGASTQPYFLDGKVGIGLAGPTAPLHVAATTSTAYAVYIDTIPYLDGPGASHVLTISTNGFITAKGYFGSNLTTCGDSTHALSYDSTTGNFNCQAIAGTGGGGTSALAINQNSVQITSQTVAINALSPPFVISSVGGGTTAQWTLDFSSITALGPGPLSGSNIVLISSSIAFGSSANTVTSDTNTLTWDNTVKQMAITGTVVISTPISTTYTGDTLKIKNTGNGGFSPNGGGIGLYLRNNSASDVQMSRIYDAGSSFTAGNEGGWLFLEAMHAGSYTTPAILQLYGGNNVTQQEVRTNSPIVPTSGNTLSIFDTNYFSTVNLQFGQNSGNGLISWVYPNFDINKKLTVEDTITASKGIATSTINVSGLTASQFVRTDASKNLISYDLLNATQTWTGGNTFSSATIQNAIINSCTGSGCGSGGGGYAVEPATVTFNLAKGAIISTITINGVAYNMPSGVGAGGYFNVDTSSNVTFTAGTGGVSWGAITGTLSSQSDLQTALNNIGISTAAIAVSTGVLSVSTTTLATRLNSVDTSTAAMTTRLNNLDTSTASITTRLNNLDTSTSTLTSRLNTVAVDTTSLRTSLGTVATDTTSLRATLNTVATDTASLRTSLNTVATDTTTLASNTLTNSSATATYLQKSSATATYLQLSSATATYLQQSSATVSYCHADGTNCTATGGGGVVVPSTFTWGTVNMSTVTASSVTVTGQVNISSGPFNFLSSMPNPDILRNPAYAEDNVAALMNVRWPTVISGTNTQVTNIYSQIENSSTSVNPLANMVSVYGYSRDHANANGNLVGTEGRVTGQGPAAAYTAGWFATEWVGNLSPGTTSSIEGVRIVGRVVDNSGNAISTGTLKLLYIPDPTGSGAANKTWAIYSSAKYPSFFDGKMGIGTAGPTAQLTVAVATATASAIIVGTIPYVDQGMSTPYIMNLTTAGSLNVTGITAGSATVTGAGGVSVTNNLSAGSMSGSGLADCGDSTHALGYASGTGLFSCQSITGTGGSGASTLGMSSGSATNSVVVSSPTGNVVVDSNTFVLSLQGSTTAFLKLNPSSVTLQGVVTAASLGAITGNQSITVSGDSSGSGTTAITLTANPVQSNIRTFSSSVTVTGAGGIANTYGIVTGSVTANTSMTIPNGANPTVDTTGEIALDTTAGQLLAYDGSAVNVVGSSTKSFTVTISSGVGWSGLSIPVWRSPTNASVTITKILAESLPASTTVQYQLDERAFGSINTAGTSVFSVAFSSANNTGVTSTSFSNASIAAQNSLVLTTPAGSQAAGGSPDVMTLTVYYKEDRQ